MNRFLFIWIILPIIYLLTGCNNFNDKIQGGWVIDSIEGTMILTNGITFNVDKSCSLPMIAISDRLTHDDIGQWKVFRKGSNIFLEITSKNKIFNNIYHISKLQRIQDTVSLGFTIKMTLVSKEQRLYCTKVFNE